VHGEAALPAGAWEIRDRLERDGIAFIDHSIPKDSALPDWYQNTWHAPWYVFEHWGRWFEIRAYLPGGTLGIHDHVLLERRPDEAPAGRPLAARPPLPAKGAPESRVADALATARAGRDQPGTGEPVVTIRALARRLVLRAIRPYSAHEDDFDDAVAASIAELSRASDHHAAALKALEHRLDERG
jgi:hypothetical protein